MAAPGAKCSISVAAIQVEPGMNPLRMVCTSCGASVISTSKRPDVALGAICSESVTRKRSGDLGFRLCGAAGDESRRSAQRAEQTKLPRRGIEQIPFGQPKSLAANGANDANGPLSLPVRLVRAIRG